MDDALSMVTLYAHLPSTDKIKSERTRNCKRLCLEFNNWVVRERALQKVFLSIKGCYFQAQIQGQPVTWLVPYEFSQELPEDVDYKVMRTFLEFYETQLHFINFRLYAASGLIYPPKLDAKLDAADAGLSSYRLESKEAAAAANSGLANAAGRAKKDPRLRSLEGKLATLEREAGAAAPEAAGPAAVEEDLNALINPDGDEEGGAGGAGGEDRPLFDGLKVFISREVPRHIFEFVARALGARVGWEGEGSPFSESDESITHQVLPLPRPSPSSFGPLSARAADGRTAVTRVPGRVAAHATPSARGLIAVRPGRRRRRTGRWWTGTRSGDSS